MHLIIKKVLQVHCIVYTIILKMQQFLMRTKYVSTQGSNFSVAVFISFYNFFSYSKLSEL